MSSDFFKGMRHGIPIALGYLSVSFGFGILAVNMGLTVAQAVGISVTNLTSAGQVMGVTVIAAGGSLFEMALTQLVINLRYALMGLSLSRKLDSSFNTPRRMLVSYGITDEIFAVASAQPKKVSPQYMYGLILVSFLGWSIGTFIGAFSGQILPQSIINAMGIVLYGMFIAIVIPVAKRRKVTATEAAGTEKRVYAVATEEGVMLFSADVQICAYHGKQRICYHNQRCRRFRTGSNAL